MKARQDTSAGLHGGPYRAESSVLDWEDARIFLAVSRQPSLRAASAVLNQSINALRRRILNFERKVGVAVFTRHVDGIRLTPEGEHMVAVAQRMELDACDFVRATSVTATAGDVRIAITEGLGTFWLAPQLPCFHRDNPTVVIDLQCMMTPADILRLEADISIQLVRPHQKDLRLVKLGRLHSIPFCASSYAEAHGIPHELADLRKHSVVFQFADQVSPPIEYLRRVIGESDFERIALRTNSSSAHAWAILSGVGLGMLPTYACAIGAPLIPIDLGMHTEHDIWLVCHPDSSVIPRVRRTIDFLVEAFSPQRFPWFADEFIHPDRLPRGRLLHPVAGLEPRLRTA